MKISEGRCSISEKAHNLITSYLRQKTNEKNDQKTEDEINLETFKFLQNILTPHPFMSDKHPHRYPHLTLLVGEALRSATEGKNPSYIDIDVKREGEPHVLPNNNSGSWLLNWPDTPDQPPTILVLPSNRPLSPCDKERRNVLLILHEAAHILLHYKSLCGQKSCTPNSTVKQENDAWFCCFSFLGFLFSEYAYFCRITKSTDDTIDLFHYPWGLCQQ